MVLSLVEVRPRPHIGIHEDVDAAKLRHWKPSRDRAGAAGAPSLLYKSRPIRSQPMSCLSSRHASWGVTCQLRDRISSRAAEAELDPRCPAITDRRHKPHSSEPGARPLARGGPGDKTFAPSATVFLRRLPFDPSPLGLNIEFRDLIHGCFEQPGGATLLLQRMPANRNISRHQLVTKPTATTRPL